MEFTNHNEHPLTETETEHNEGKHINIDGLKAIAKGDTSFLLKLIAHFLAETPASVEKMKGLLEAGNYKELGAMAHKIKPSTSYLGLPELDSDIKQIEDYALNEKNTEELPELITRFRAEISKAIDQLKEERKKLGA